MARYIDAEKFEKDIIGKAKVLNDEIVFESTFVYSTLYQQPTADVVEVKRGKWEVTEHSEHLNVICSNCNEDFYVYKKGQYRIDRSNYCPKCGASMEREGK